MKLNLFLQLLLIHRVLYFLLPHQQIANDYTTSLGTSPSENLSFDKHMKMMLLTMRTKHNVSEKCTEFMIKEMEFLFSKCT